MKINDAVFGVLLLALGIAVLWHVQSFPKMPGQNVGPALFAGSIAAGIIVCALLLIVSGLRSRPAARWFEGLPWTRSPRHVAAFAALVLATIAYILFSTSVGFLKDNYPKVERVEVEKNQEMFNLVEIGRADAAVTGKPAAKVFGVSRGPAAWIPLARIWSWS